MPTKRCQICSQFKQIEERGVCCEKCHEAELDMLMMTYAYIHCSGGKYCAPQELIENIGQIHGIKLNLTFLRSWINRQWLERNDLDAVGVPPPIQDDLMESGFTLTQQIVQQLTCLKEHKPPSKTEFGNPKDLSAEKQSRLGMAYLNRKR